MTELCPKKITIADQEFIMHKFPALKAREISVKYAISSLPKFGDYKQNEQMAIDLLSFVAVEDNNAKIFLSCPELIDKYIPPGKHIFILELAMMEYNFDFFKDGLVSSFFENLTQKAIDLGTKMLTSGLELLSQVVKQPSESSENPIH